MKKYLPILLVLAVTALVIVGLFALRPAPDGAGGGNAAQADGEEKVIIISPNNEGIQREFARAFSEWHQAKYGKPCGVDWRDHGGTSDAVRYIKSEFSRVPAGIGVDIMWGGGMEPYLQFSEMGLLEKIKIPEETLGRIPKTLAGMPVYDPAGRWYGTAMSSFGIIYNRTRLHDLKLPEPKTWEDLASPAFFNEVGAADPRNSGTAQMMVEVILQAYGWEKGFEVMTRTAGNVKSVSRSASEVPDLVGMGDIGAGLAIDFYAWLQIKSSGKERVGFALPDGLTPVTPDAIGVLRGAPHREAAERFVAFVLSAEGQRLWVLPKGAPGGPVEFELLRIPVLLSVLKEHEAVTNVMFDPAAMNAQFDYDPVKAAARRDSLKDLYGALFVELTPELKAAWKGVIARGLRPEEVKLLCTPPVTEAELSSLGTTVWGDPVARNDHIKRWTNSAHERYRQLAR